MEFLQNNMLTTLFWFLPVIHLYLCIRFAIKASCGQVDNYSFLKMALVVFLPFIGYYIATKEEVPVS